MGSEVRLLFPPPLKQDAGVTQWLEFLPSKQAVEGSNPFTRSNEILEAEVQFHLTSYNYILFYINIYIVKSNHNN